jgi:hypothetical protein
MFTVKDGVCTRQSVDGGVSNNCVDMPSKGLLHFIKNYKPYTPSSTCFKFPDKVGGGGGAMTFDCAIMHYLVVNDLNTLFSCL